MKHQNIFSLFLILVLLTGNLYSQTSWVQQNSNTTNKINSIYFLDANTGFACSDGGLFLKTTNSGINWTVYNTGFFLSLKSVMFFNPLTGIIASDKLLRTTNGGLNWFMVRDSVFGKDIYKLNSSIAYLSGIVNMPPFKNNLKTTNAGESWIDLTQVDWGHLAVHFVNESTGYLAHKQFVFTWTTYGISKTTNGGVNWINQFSETSYHSICYIYDIFFPSINTGFAVGYNQTTYKFFKTYNGGVNWSIDASTELYSIYFVNDYTGWVCGINGVVEKTTNSCQSWLNSPTQTSNNLNSIYFVDNYTGWVAGNGGIILKTTNGGIVPVESTSSEIPERFSLSQNYPNPFNPSTKIKFDITTPLPPFRKGGTNVSLKVYDLIGNEVGTLVNEQLKPGTYEVEFNGENFSSGAYYYTLQTESFKETKRMVLVK